MATQRKNRGKMIRVALVGYTNVGKSTLMNVISKKQDHDPCFAGTFLLPVSCSDHTP